MKRRYYLSMLGVLILLLLADCIYFAFHRSFEVYLGIGLVHLLLFGVINLLGASYIYRPIGSMFAQQQKSEQGKRRIERLTRYSTAWIFALGMLFVILTTLPLLVAPSLYDSMETFDIDKMPTLFLLAGIPPVIFINAILTAFITYFLINDLSFDLKARAFATFGYQFQAGDKRIGKTLAVVLIILVLIPSLLVMLEISVAASMGESYSQFSDLNPMEITLIDRLVVFAGMLFAAVLLPRVFIRPINSLLQEVKKVGEGEYTTRAVVLSNDEIGMLTQNFNDMVQDLEVSHKELAEANRTLEKKVAKRTRELKRKNFELENAYLQLQHMQQQIIVQEKMATLGHLVAGLTHEINSPIGAMRSMIDTKSKAAKKLQKLLDVQDNGHNAQLQKVMHVIADADRTIVSGTERLGEIIKNLKLFARLDESDIVMADLNKGLDSALALLNDELLQEVEVVRKYGDIPNIRCDARKINHVFLNIIKNACQAIEGPGRITLTSALKNGNVNIAIEDTGKGIAKEELETIFDPGFTTRSASVRASLGLAICYQIVQEHNGKIQVESEAGSGSVFTVILPVNMGDG